jgi:hypothetical protein
MRPLSFLSVILFMGVCGSPSLYAQEKPKDSQNRRRSRMQRSFEELALSEPQKKKLEAVMSSFRGKIRKARENRDREAMSKAREAFEREVETILTKEQWKKFQAQRGRRGQRGQGGQRGQSQSGPAVGTAAPNFDLKALKGTGKVNLQALVKETKKPVVLIFGSYT